MNTKTLLLAFFLTMPGLAVSADLDKLVGAVDTDKAVESVDTEKLKSSVDGTYRVNVNKSLQRTIRPFFQPGQVFLQVWCGFKQAHEITPVHSEANKNIGHGKPVTNQVIHIFQSLIQHFSRMCKSLVILFKERRYTLLFWQNKGVSGITP